MSCSLLAQTTACDIVPLGDHAPAEIYASYDQALILCQNKRPKCKDAINMVRILGAAV